MMNDADHVSRSLGEIVSEIRIELMELLNTRLKMLKSELQETKAGLRVVLPLAAVTLIFFFTAFLLLSAAVVALVASAFAGNPYAWFFGLIIVAVLWAIFGGIAGFFAYNELRAKTTFPRRTFEVLIADKNWLESEAKETYERAA
ncbi:MAG TPA: phage holin family protein [Terriglobales bacterium]|nr:phage holin family protein [Terriglobales bacterium]